MSNVGEPPDRGSSLRRIIRLGQPSPRRLPRPQLRDAKLTSLLEKTKPQKYESMNEVDLIESLKTAQHVGDLELKTSSLPATGGPLGTVNANRPAWALDLAKNPSLRNEFEQLEVAVNEYNTVASHQKGETVIKQGCELKDVLVQAKALQQTESPNEGDRSLDNSIQAGLQQFCKSILHYAAIMDTLAQHHPEWVSLAWGTIKLLLMVPIEYQKVKEGIVTNLGRIGAKLELVSLLLSFYPFERMADAASAIYISIAEFLGFCLRYLQRNCLVKTLKTIITPFETRLGPILKTIDDNYAILRQEAEVQFMIYQFEKQCSLLGNLAEIKEGHGRILGVLEGRPPENSSEILYNTYMTNKEIIHRDEMSRKQRARAIDASQSLDRALLKPPRLEIREDFFRDLLPLDNTFHQVQLEIDLLPVSYLSESVNVLRLSSFHSWLSSKDSGLLWVDGYKIPRRPSWTTDLSLKIVRAATESGYDTLSYFGSINRGSNIATSKSRALVQSLLFSMLQKFPAVTSHGDPELFNAEILVAAKTDLDLSWRIFVECLRVLPSPMIYIVIEGVDHVDVTRDQLADFESLLNRLGKISADLLDEKIIKVALTSVRPNAGFQHLFPSHDRLEVVHEKKLLIRVPAAAARRRKPRSKAQKKTQLHLYSPGIIEQPEPTDAGSDFAPSDSCEESDGIVSDSSSDFDIYGKGKGMADHATYSWSSLTPGHSRASPVQLESAEKSETTRGQDAEDSDSSFDIYEKTPAELPQAKPASEEDLSDFAP